MHFIYPIYYPKRKHYYFGKVLYCNYICAMKKYHLNEAVHYCPVDLTLSVIGGRWQGLVIWTLRKESKRFNELKRNLVTVNDKMLSQTLKKLVVQGVVHRKSYNSIPPKVEYSLTTIGKELLPVFELMQNWGEEHNLG